MSEQPVEGADGPEAIELPSRGESAFGALMDFLVEDEGDPEAGADNEAAAAAAGGDGSDAAAAEGAAASTDTAGAPAAGAAGDPAVPPAEGGAAASPASGGGDLPATWTVSSSELIPKFGELSTKLEENTASAYQQAAFEEVQKDHPKYFEALNKPPRALVGITVPSATGEGQETLRDSEDARDWQETVKQLLVEEVRDRAGRQAEENADFLSTIHSSIELFQNNADLVPGTKEFDKTLADRFVEMAKPYELRVEGKLQGYSIPVQPIINSLRASVAAERASAGAQPPAAAPAAAPAAGAAPAPGDGPQAGIESKAGASAGDKDDYSTLFGTLGLPNFRI